VACSDHTVKAVRETLGAGSQSARVKGKDGKSYPSSVKRQPRGEPEEKEETDEPPPDPGLGGDRLSPEELAKDVASKINKAVALSMLDAVIEAVQDGTVGGDNRSQNVGRLMTLKAFIKGS
jgi:hypothetical protein